MRHTAASTLPISSLRCSFEGASGAQRRRHSPLAQMYACSSLSMSTSHCSPSYHLLWPASAGYIHSEAGHCRTLAAACRLCNASSDRLRHSGAGWACKACKALSSPRRQAGISLGKVPLVHDVKPAHHLKVSFGAQLAYRKPLACAGRTARRVWPAAGRDCWC